MSCLKVPVRLRSAGRWRTSSRSCALTENTKRLEASMINRPFVDFGILFPSFAGAPDRSGFLKTSGVETDCQCIREAQTNENDAHDGIWSLSRFRNCEN